MGIKNFDMNRKVLAICLGGTLILSSCGNKQIFDFDKSFNVVVEVNDDNVSVVGIKEYADYEGSQVQFVTNDNLRVLTSTLQTQLLKVENESSLNNYVYAVSGNNEDAIVNYDELQGIDIDFSDDIWNKNVFDFNYTYDKAIILSDGVATIVNINSWKDYEDDKIQIKLSDNTCVLTNIDKIKLVNDDAASEDSLSNYALSLVGDSDKVIFYDAAKSK